MPCAYPRTRRKSPSCRQGCKLTYPHLCHSVPNDACTVLFPPCTLLIVKVQSANADDELKKFAEEQSSGRRPDARGWQLVRALLSEIIVHREHEQWPILTEQVPTSPAHTAPQNSRGAVRSAADVIIQAESRDSTFGLSSFEESEISTNGLDDPSSTAPGLMSFVGGLGAKTLEVFSSPLSFGRSLISGEVASEPQSSSSALCEGPLASSMRSSPPSSPSCSNSTGSRIRRLTWGGATPQSLGALASPLPAKAIKNKSNLLHSHDHIHRKGKHLHHTMMELEGKTFFHVQVSPSFI